MHNAESLLVADAANAHRAAAAWPHALHLEIVTVNAVVFAGEVYYVSVPGADGRIGLLPGHDPVLALLKPGDVHIALQKGDAPQGIAILGGMVEAGRDYVSILADHVVHSAEAESLRQQEARQRAGQIAMPTIQRRDFAGLKAELDAELARFFELILMGR